MKKFLLLICALLGTVGSWAAVTMPTLTTDANNPVLYAIQSYRSYHFEQYAGDDAAITPTFDFSSTNAKFYFIAVNGSNFDDGVKIVSSVNGKQLVEVGTGFADEGTTWYIKENPYNTGFLCISKTSDLSSGCWDCNGSGVMTTGYWRPASGDAEGTSWSIVEVPQYETSTLENPKWYYLKTGRGRYVYADGTNAGTNTSNPKTDAYKFAFISVGGTGVNIVSKAGLGGNQYLTTTPGVSSTASTWYYFGAARYPGYFLFSDDASGYGYPHLLNDNGNGGLAKWYVDGTGSYFQVEEVLPVCDVTYTYTYGGNTYSATETQDIGAAVSLPASITFPYTNYSFSTDVVPDASAATINVTVDGFDMPFTASTDYASATWYYLHGHASYNAEYYISTNGTAIAFKKESLIRDDAHKWAFIGNPIEGIKIINKASGEGNYINGTNPATMGSTEKTWELKQQTNTSWYCGTRGFGFYDSSLKYLNSRSSGDIQYWSALDQGSTFWLAEDVDAVTSDKSALGELIAAAQALVDNAGILGYINSTAATTLSTAITTAQAVYDDPTGDYGSAYSTLASAVSTAAVPANINYTPRTDVYYTIVNARGAMVYDSSHSSSVDATNDNAEYLWYGSTTPDATDPNNLWGFIERDGNYYMYNVGKKQFASVGTGTYGSTWIFSNTPAYITLDDGIADEIVPPGVRVRATIATTGNSYTMSVSTSYTGPVITYDANGDGGVPMVFAESTYAVNAEVTAAIEALLEDLTPYRNALKEVIEGCTSIPFGSGLNQYTSDDTYTATLAAANTAYEDESATKTDLQTAKTNLETAISGLTLNLPTAGFYRIKGKTSSMYLAAGLASNSKFNMSDATDGSTIFYFDGTMLVNYGSGMANGMTKDAWEWVTDDAASTVAFIDGLSLGGYAIQSDTAYFYDNGDNSQSADRGANLTIEGANARYVSWYLEEVTELPVTFDYSVDGKYYTTLCLPYAAEVTSATAFTLDRGNGNILDKSEGSATIAAGTPVLLESESNSATVALSGEKADPQSETALTGTYAATTIDAATDYVLGTDGTKAGFFHSEENVVKGFSAFLAGDENTGSIEAFYFDPIDLAGDVNGDGSVTIADVTALVNIILGKDTEGQYNHAAADVNNDESITIADVTALVNIILGKTN